MENDSVWIWHLSVTLESYIEIFIHLKLWLRGATTSSGWKFRTSFLSWISAHVAHSLGMKGTEKNGAIFSGEIKSTWGDRRGYFCDNLVMAVASLTSAVTLCSGVPRVSPPVTGGDGQVARDSTPSPLSHDTLVAPEITPTYFRLSFLREYIYIYIYIFNIETTLARCLMFVGNDYTWKTNRW